MIKSFKTGAFGANDFPCAPLYGEDRFFIGLQIRETQGDSKMKNHRWTYGILFVLTVAVCLVTVRYAVKKQAFPVFSFQAQEVTEIQIINGHGESVWLQAPDQIQEIVHNLNQFRAVREGEIQSEGWDIGIALYDGEKTTGIIILTRNSVTVDEKVYYSALGEGFSEGWLEQLRAQIQDVNGMT